MSYNNSIVRIIEAESYEQRLERMHEYQDKNHKFPNVEAVLTRPEGSNNTAVKLHYLGANIVTDAGDVYYAQQGAGAAPTNDFAASGRFTLRGASDTPAKADTYDLMSTPITASNQVIDNTYPKTNDTGDPDNTGDGTKVVSYRVSYTTTSFADAAIQGGCIHIGGGSPTTGTALLTHFSITSFAKTTSDTLKLFVNHSFAGV